MTATLTLVPFNIIGRNYHNYDFCHDKTFVVTKPVIVAAPANDNSAIRRGRGREGEGTGEGRGKGQGKGGGGPMERVER